MGFVGGDGNIAMATALPPSFFCIVLLNTHTIYGFDQKIFNAYLRLWFDQFCTLSGRIGKVVASHAAVARSVPALRLH